jgi:hypothetical protein
VLFRLGFQVRQVSIEVEFRDFLAAVELLDAGPIPGSPKASGPYS